MDKIYWFTLVKYDLELTTKSHNGRSKKNKEEPGREERTSASDGKSSHSSKEIMEDSLHKQNEDEFELKPPIKRTKYTRQKR